MKSATTITPSQAAGIAGLAFLLMASSGQADAGVTIGPLFDVGPVTGQTSYNGSAPPAMPVISHSPGGNYVVAWNDYPSMTATSSTERYSFRSYSADGAPLSGVISIAGYLDAVAMDLAGDFVVLWNTETWFTGTLYAQTFSADGTAKESPIRVASLPGLLQDSGSFFSKTAGMAISMDDVGNFVVGWTVARGLYGTNLSGDRYPIEESSKTYAVCYDVNGTTTKPKTVIETSKPIYSFANGASFGQLSGFSMNSVGHIAVLYRTAQMQPTMQILDLNLNAQSPSFSIPAPETDIYFYFGGALLDSSDNLTFLSRSDSSFTITHLSWAGTVLGVVGPISLPALPTSVSLTKLGTFDTVWSDYDANDFGNNPGNTKPVSVYGQRYNADGTANGPVIVIDDGTAQLNRGSPSIAPVNDSSGNFTAVWLEVLPDSSAPTGYSYDAVGRSVTANSTP